METLRQAAGVADAGFALGTTRGLLLKQYLHAAGTAGGYDDTSRVPLASASKLLSGVRVMQAVERGQVDLDTHVDQYLPGYTGTKALMTLREMFSHTAGYGDDLDSPVLAVPTITLQQSAAYIAGHIDQTFLPVGSQFAYGGLSMQVGGALVEARSGEDWELGWKNHVGAPLRVTSIDWQGLGATTNYRISGGAQATLPDYARVLAMLLGNGLGNGTRVLRPESVATLAHDQTNHAALGYSPPGADGNTHYGVGAWIDTVTEGALDSPATATTISSIGKFGATPWVDFGRGYFGVILIEQRATQLPTVGQRAHDALVDISAIVRSNLAADCPLVETFDAVFRDGLEGPP